MKRKTIIILIIVGVLLVLGAVAGSLFFGSKTHNTTPIRIYIPEGTSQEALVDTLQSHGILEEGLNTKIFNSQFSILNSKVRAGSYVVEPCTKSFTLVRRFRNGQQDPVRLTIGKFRTPQQLNEYLNSKLMCDDFDISLDSFYLIRPNTYEFYWTVTPEQFMQRMKKEYEIFWSARECKGVQGSAGTIDQTETIVLHSPALHGTPCTPKEIIILASIVEEESNYNPEKPLIASVYLNRLRRGMPLQADPTVKYAVGDFTLQRILNRHLTTESPFNTYLHTGLPPAPICLPSDASVDAVVNAPETEYLYFCASEKMDGTHRFAASLAEHNRNAAAFHQVLNARGIR